MGGDSFLGVDYEPINSEFNPQREVGEESTTERDISAVNSILLDDFDDDDDDTHKSNDSDDQPPTDVRLRDYPIPLVAQTVDLCNDDTEPILTFRFWILSTFWVIVGCIISTVYYFKPYSVSVTSYVVQLLSWGMGSAMARYLPRRQFTTFGMSWNLNGSPWNAKEHALIVVAYWGSSYTAYGLGPLSAMELYYKKRIDAGWSIVFLMTTQLMGYGFAGLYRDALVRPPQMFSKLTFVFCVDPGVLPNVALFRSMHKNPSLTSNSFIFFSIVAICTFCYQWLPSLFWPMLSSIPLLCYMGAGNWKAFILGSGTYGFGLLDISLDWNYISFFSPMYTPLWANANRFAGAIFSCWILYPIMYFSNIANTQNYAAMSSGTWDKTGAKYNISLVLNSDFTLNKTAMNLYSMPKWSASYAMHFFWGFASSTAVLIYCLLFHANSSWKKILKSWRNERTDYDDPYLKLTAHLPRVPHWWYASLLGVCVVFAALQLYMSQMQLPFWGLLLITALSALFTLPSGLLFGFTNVYVGMEYLSELLAGFLFPGKPIAVLTSMVYGRQVLAQCLNMISDIKFGFYMKIPEHELFYAQVYGTLLGPFVNWACMRLIIDLQGPKLTGEVASNTWNALKTKNFYSLSVIWGVIGPSIFFSQMSDYGWIYYGFVVGIASVVLVWLVQRRMGYGDVESYVNPVLMFNGASIFPIYTTTNLMTSVITAFLIMGYTYRVHTGWFHKYNYLIGAGLDCGSQLVQVGIVFVSSFPAAAIPSWWGNNAVAVDRCFPPSDLPKNALN